MPGFHIDLHVDWKTEPDACAYVDNLFAADVSDAAVHNVHALSVKYMFNKTIIVTPQRLWLRLKVMVAFSRRMCYA
jgi:hypothetical protein